MKRKADEGEPCAALTPPFRNFQKASNVSVQELKPIKGSDNLYEVVNSPYGTTRNTRYGWGNVFKKIPAVPKDQRIHIGLSSLNAVPMPGGRTSRDMKQLFCVYGGKFKALEHCATFYRLNEENSWKSWREMARSAGGSKFKITVKAHKNLTHESMLALTDDTRAHIIDFVQKLRLLGDNLGAVLMQLPASFKYSDENLKRLSDLGSVLPKDINFAFDFRSPSMFTEKVYSVLRENNWATVLYHLTDVNKDFTTPYVNTSDSVVYIRLHGSVQQFSGDYGDAYLSKWAEYINTLLKADTTRDIYVFFNNNESQSVKVPSSIVDSTCLATLLNNSEEKTAAQPAPKKIKVEIELD